jgi:serine phosphatase RsbU (regulator of sigma subunit)
LNHGETLIGFTDGVTDACASDGEMFSRVGVVGAIHGCDGLGNDFMQAILDGVFDHLDICDLTDDIAMISIARGQRTS